MEVLFQIEVRAGSDLFDCGATSYGRILPAIRIAPRLSDRPLLLRFALFLTSLPADHDTLDDYGTALTHGLLPGIPF